MSKSLLAAENEMFSNEITKDLLLILHLLQLFKSLLLACTYTFFSFATVLCVGFANLV